MTKTKTQILNTNNDAEKQFNCWLCRRTFIRDNICYHYDDDEMDDNGEVSLCDNCAKDAMDKAKQMNMTGLSRKFFNCIRK